MAGGDNVPRMTTPRVLRLPMVVTLVFSLAPAGCRRSAAPVTIRIAHETNVLTLDPTGVGDATTYSVLSNICEGLVAFDRDMRLVPALAVSWNVVDEHGWLIELRQGVRFHDGGILTASDVKLALDRARNDPASGVRSRFSTVQDVEVVGEHTLKLTTIPPDALLLNRLVTVLIGRVPGAGAHPEHPVGTGPYRFVGRTKEGLVELASFEGYWGGKPPIDRASFLPVEKERHLALTQGRVDVLEAVPEPMVDTLGSLPGIRILAQEGLATNYLWINSRQKRGGAANPFADKRVRQAVSLAIDRWELARRLGGHVIPANQLVQKGVYGHISSFPKLPFDPAAARRFLMDAGYGGGFDTTLVYNPGGPRDLVVETVRHMLGEVGIRARLESSEWPSMVSQWSAGRLPFFLAGWNFDDGDASSFLKDCLSSPDSARHIGGFNPGFSNAALDRLIAENAEILGKFRLEHYERLMRLAMDEMPVVPLYHRLNFYGVSKRVRWEPRLDGKLLASEMSLVTP